MFTIIDKIIDRIKDYIFHLRINHSKAAMEELKEVIIEEIKRELENDNNDI